ncbi:hypothetical protein E4U41_000983 [Claviceps citrina]|nr:hypothetical protein E4U41_000983 [Claviceps citrina]
MAGQTVTLRHVLTQQKPPLSCKAKYSRHSTRNDWPHLAMQSLAIWEEFNLNNLNESYGHVLDFPISDQLLVTPQADQALAGVAIDTDLDINRLISWNKTLIDPAIQFAKSHLNLSPGIMIRHKHSTADKTSISR